MLTASLFVLSLAGMPLQPLPQADTQEPQAQVQAQTAAPTAPRSTSPVRSITAQSPVTGPTQTVCGWERPTGSTMRRRVCREVAADRLSEYDTRDMLRQMQGSRYGELPVPRQPGGRAVF